MIGYNTATLGSSSSDSLNALETLTLANGGNATLTSTQTKLNVSVNKTSGTLDVSSHANVADLDITATGTASTFVLTATDLKNLTIDANAEARYL